MRRPLVYGIIGKNLILMPEDVAEAYVSDHEAIVALKTFGDARRFVPRGSINNPPGVDDWEDLYGEEGPPDDDPYDAVALVESWEDYPWPPSAATIALEELPDDLRDIGEEVENFPFESALHIDPAFEQQLLETIRSRGYEIHRDDVLIGRI